MTKTIDTLVPDILGLIDAQQHSIIDHARDRFGNDLAGIIASRLFRGTDEPTLRFSNLGSPCERKLWYEINNQSGGDPLPPDARIKFLFGDILEHLLLFLAREAGHTVEGEQETVEINGILGHFDAIIDGVVVDVKSASTYSFNKFKSHELETNDPFGYLDQISAYHYALKNDPRVTEKNKVAFLAVDKQLGHLCLDVYEPRKTDYPTLIEYRKSLVAQKNPPPRGFKPEADGKSGNMKLGTFCSYCNHKSTCYPNLRVFAYSSGPRFLTSVERLPDVPEVTKK